jgi:hypothetical protein
VSHLQIVSVEREQACKKVIPWETEVRRELCLVAAESPAADNGKLEAHQISHPEDHAGQTPLCLAWPSSTLSQSQLLKYSRQ